MNICECVTDHKNQEFYRCRYCRVAEYQVELDRRLCEADAAISDAKRLVYLLGLVIREATPENYNL